MRLNPQTVEPTQHRSAATTDAWFACYTRARHEKRVAERLRSAGFEVFLPLAVSESQWHDRKKLIEWPAFPGYVFVRCDLADAAVVTGTPGVVTLVTHGGRPARIPDEEIANVRKFLSALAKSGFEPEPVSVLEIGQQVRFRSGPMEGVEAFVVGDRGKRRVLVQVGLASIGKGLKVDVDRAQLEEI